MQVERTPYGFRYAAIRRPIKDAQTHDYIRSTVFVANLATRLGAGDDIFTATRFGVYAATLKVTRKGAAMASPTPSEVQKFISENN